MRREKSLRAGLVRHDAGPSRRGRASRGAGSFIVRPSAAARPKAANIRYAIWILSCHWANLPGWSAGGPTPCSPSMQPRHVLVTLIALASLASTPALAEQGYKFGQEDESDRAEQEARQSRIAEQLSTPCRAGLKDKKIMLVIGVRQSN